MDISEKIMEMINARGWELTNEWDGGSKKCYTNKDFPGYAIFVLTGAVNHETMAEPLKAMDSYDACLNFSYDVAFRISPLNYAKLYQQLPKNPNLIIAAVDQPGLAGWVTLFTNMTSTTGDLKTAYKTAVTTGKKPKVMLKFKDSYFLLIPQFEELAAGNITDISSDSDFPFPTD